MPKRKRPVESICEEIADMTREERGALMSRIQVMSLPDADKVAWGKMIVLIDLIADQFDDRKPT